MKNGSSSVGIIVAVSVVIFMFLQSPAFFVLGILLFLTGLACFRAGVFAKEEASAKTIPKEPTKPETAEEFKARLRREREKARGPEELLQREQTKEYLDNRKEMYLDPGERKVRNKIRDFSRNPDKYADIDQIQPQNPLSGSYYEF